MAALALALAAVGTLAGVLVIVPRRFATAPGAAASAGPADRAGPPAQAAPAPSIGKNPADHHGYGLLGFGLPDPSR
jgi:hypothetical protein